MERQGSISFRDMQEKVLCLRHYNKQQIHTKQNIKTTLHVSYLEQGVPNRWRHTEVQTSQYNILYCM